MKMIIIVMGVSGVGKTTIGRKLAERLGCPFSDADEFHSEASIGKMRAGIELSDEDRLPWLARIRAALVSSMAIQEDRILACSALTAPYRHILRKDDGVIQFVYLRATEALVRSRLVNRTGHFFSPELLKSQFAILQEPSAAEALGVNAALAPDTIVDQIVTALVLESGEY
jgi:gluconokinase